MKKELFIFASLLFSLQAWGSSTGIVGYPCSFCHSGPGPRPRVLIEGPTTLAIGSTQQAYRVTITGGAAVVGGVAVTVRDGDGALNPGEGLQKLAGGGLTHTVPKPFVGDSVSFDLTLDAPSKAQILTLVVAANSADNNGDTFGDETATSQLNVRVVSALSSPDAGSETKIDIPREEGSVEIPPVEDSTSPPKEGCQSTSGSVLAGGLMLLWGFIHRRPHSVQLAKPVGSNDGG